MTKSDGTETEPLLISKEQKLHSSYNAVSFDRRPSSTGKEDNTNDVTVRMEPLMSGIAKPNMHIFMNGKDKPSPSPSPSPDTDVLPPQAADRITYTWHEMDVFAPGSERRRRKWYDLMTDTKEPVPMKHILKNDHWDPYDLDTGLRDHVAPAEGSAACVRAPPLESGEAMECVPASLLEVINALTGTAFFTPQVGFIPKDPTDASGNAVPDV